MRAAPNDARCIGACPRVVLEAQFEWRLRLEREPVRFFVNELEPLLDEVREVVGRFVGAVGPCAVRSPPG